MNEYALSPSLGAVRWVFITHLLALVLMLIVVEQRIALIALSAGVGVSWFALRRHRVFGFGRRAVTGLRHRGEAEWEARIAGRDWCSAELLPATRVLGRGLLLVLRCGERRHTRLVRGTDLEPDALRRLRVDVIETLRAP